MIVHWKYVEPNYDSFHVICLYRFGVCVRLSIFSMNLPLRIPHKFSLSTCLVIAFSCMRLMVVSFPLCKMGMSPFSICLVGVVVVAFLLSEEKEKKKRLKNRRKIKRGKWWTGRERERERERKGKIFRCPPLFTETKSASHVNICLAHLEIGIFPAFLMQTVVITTAALFSQSINFY